MKKIQLTNSQKENFHENGFLIIEKVLDDGDLQDVIDEFYKLHETFMGKPVTNRFGVSWGEMTVEDV